MEESRDGTSCVRSAFVTYPSEGKDGGVPPFPPSGLQIACQLDHNREPGIAR